MNIAGHIEALRADLIATAGIGDEGTLRVAEHLSRALDPAMRLRLLDILSEAALEVNGQLTSGQIEVRLAGGDVAFTYSESSHEAEPAGAELPGGAARGPPGPRLPGSAARRRGRAAPSRLRRAGRDDSSGGQRLRVP